MGPPLPECDHLSAPSGWSRACPGSGLETALLLEGQLFVPHAATFPDFAKPLFEHDVLVGIRHALNDEVSRWLTIFAIVDVVRPEELVISGGYAQRLGEAWSLTPACACSGTRPEIPPFPQVVRAAERQPPAVREPYSPFLIATRKERLP